MTRLALLGASGLGKVVADAALAGGWDAVEFFDDAWPQRKSNGPWPILRDDAKLLAQLSVFDCVLLSPGYCALRWQKHQTLMNATRAFHLKTGAQPAVMLSALTSANFRAHLRAMEGLA